MSEEDSDLLTIAYMDGYHRRDDEVRDLIKQKAQAYAERNKCIMGMAKMALDLGYTAGLGMHEDKPGELWDDDWRHIVFIDLPTGQVSWHIHDSEVPLFNFLPVYEGVWDGHTTGEKYERLMEL